MRGTCAVPETSNVVSPVDPFIYYGGSLTVSCKSIDRAEKRETEAERFAELFRSFLSLLRILVFSSFFQAYQLLYSFMLCLKCRDTDRELKLNETRG